MALSALEAYSDRIHPPGYRITRERLEHMIEGLISDLLILAHENEIEIDHEFIEYNAGEELRELEEAGTIEAEGSD
jgi:hypothetical protein